MEIMFCSSIKGSQVHRCPEKATGLSAPLQCSPSFFGGQSSTLPPRGYFWSLTA